MAFLDFLQPPDPQPCYLYPELSANTEGTATGQQRATSLANDQTLVFQYWPEQVSDEFQTNWSPKDVPGGSHPLYQWTGGGGRTISFDAVFTAEVDEGINDRLATGRRAIGGANAVEGLPSSRYHVDVAAALGRLRSFQMASYRKGDAVSVAQPPPRLHLVLPGSSIGGTSDGKAVDEIFCILLSAPITYEAFFPSGRPRIATVSLSFAEVVQRSSAQGSLVQFIGREPFVKLGQGYKYRGGLERSTGV